MENNILALGDRFSAAYSSLAHELINFGKISYYSEHKFKNVEDALSYIGNSSFNLVMMPNPYGNKRRMCIYKELKKRNFPVITFDRGALPNSWFFDTGFNADSNTYHPLNWDKKLNINNKKEIIEYIDEVKKGNVALEAQGKRIGGELLKDKLGLSHKKIIFVPFQRPDDTVIKFFSKGYKEFIIEVEKLNNYINKNMSEDWILIAKKHPLETKIPSKHLNFVEDDINIYDLIEISEQIVLINSGVGLLSMLWKKPVLYFGDIFYGHPHLNTKVTSYLDILYFMHNPQKVEEDKMYSFISYLKNNVYSFANFETEEILQKDGNYRNITRFIDFYSVQFPDVKNIIKKKYFLLHR